MFPSTTGSFRLFRVAGIDIYAHWSWLLVIVLEAQVEGHRYGAWPWYAAELIVFVLLVLLHELGHALACRHVGGFADSIVLWPLGGVALVNPPPQPASWLWTVAAGPTVNLLLLPLTVGLTLIAVVLRLDHYLPDLLQLISAATIYNLVLLIFNLLPIYPLDGGQILMALLWFRLGRPHSLMVVSVLGIGFGGLGLLVAFAAQNLLLSILALFIVFQALMGFQRSRYLARLLSGPRHLDAVCPSCGVSPLVGDLWRCDACGTSFDTFEHQGHCPQCGKGFEQTRCPECYHLNPLPTWMRPDPEPEDQQPVLPTGQRDSFTF